MRRRVVAALLAIGTSSAATTGLAAGLAFATSGAPTVGDVPPRPRFSVVFSAECNALFDWHSAGLFYSFTYSNFSKSASLTRLLACSESQLADYPPSRLDIGPTFVHRNLRDDPLVDEEGYPSYNKPFSGARAHRRLPASQSRRAAA